MDSRMDCIKEDHMGRFKKGKLKSKEEFVYVKLMSLGPRDRPELHVYTDGSQSDPSSVIKVKSFAAVRESDQVPKIVKAKYENYLYISDGGTQHYLKTDNRQQRDEWCNLLQTFFNPQSNSPQGHRHRTQTDTGSNKPPVTRQRKGDVASAPATAKGIFQDELRRTVQKRDRDHDDISESDHAHDHDHMCCPRHHFESEGEYENVHSVGNKGSWRRDNGASNHALQESAILYSDFHNLAELQCHVEDPDESQYENPSQDYPTGTTSNRLSTCSSSSEDSNAMSRAKPLRSRESSSCRRQPVEDSWPPSPEPEHSTDDATPSFVHPAANPGPAFQQELATALQRKMSLTTSEAKVSSTIELEPEAKLCMEDQQIYQNIGAGRQRGNSINPPPSLPRKKTSSPAAKVQQPLLPRRNSINPPPTLPQKKTGSPAAKVQQPLLPPQRKTSIEKGRSSAPPGLPKRNNFMRAKALKNERVTGGPVKVPIDKTTLLNNMPYLKVKHDKVLVISVPRAVRDYFRVGDQWLKVNDQLLSRLEFAYECIRMSDKSEVVITVKRIPMGSICDFAWPPSSGSRDIKQIGLKLQGPEVVELSPTGLAHTEGHLQSIDTFSLGTIGVGCHYAITEINFQPVHPEATTEEVWDMIKATVSHLVLILHPVDFLSIQLHDDEDIYENLP